MALDSAGPTTGVLAALATSIGLGLVVGGFFAGAIGFVSTRSQEISEKWAFLGGYAGGFLALGLRVIDIFWRSFV
jgi:hypothetical protein